MNLSASSAGGGPSPRYYSMMAANATDGVLLLFGGVNPSTGATLGDTWSFQARTWTNLTPHLAVSPSPRSGAGVAFDPSSDAFVLFGGLSPTGRYLNDTWVYRAGAWTNVSATAGPAPPGLYLPTLTEDSTDGLVLLEGGTTPGGAGYAGTWTWRDGRWTDLTGSLATSPGGRFLDEAADDPADGGVMIFGGYNGNVTYYNDTWLFHAGTWTNVTPAGANPPPLIYGDLGYAGPNGTEVLTQGAWVGPDGIPRYSSFTWAWSLGRWTNVSGQLPPSSLPPLRLYAPVAQVTGPGACVVVFGGEGTMGGLSDLESLGLPSHVVTSFVPSLLLVGQPANYSASLSGGVGPLHWGWSFGDGGTSSTLSGTHAYAGTGNYTASFAWTDGTGATAWSNTSVEVVSRLTVVASARPAQADLGMSISFQSVVAGGGPGDTYAWSFGDGVGRSTSPDPSYVYGASGTFTASLQVSTSGGTSAWSNVSVAVAPLPAATITAVPAAESFVNQTVHFGSGTTGGIGPYGFNWNFGDGSSSSLPDPSQIYTTPGTYLVALEVTDSLGRSANASASYVVVQNGTPEASPLVDRVLVNRSSGSVGTEFLFNATPSGGVPPYTVEWNFGDGATGSGRSAAHAFARPGTFEIWANASDDVGHLRRSSVNVTVTPNATSTTTPPGNSSQPGSSGATAFQQLVGSVWPWVLLVAIVAAALAGLLLLRRRGRGSGGAPASPSDGSEPSPPGETPGRSAGGAGPPDPGPDGPPG